MSLSDILLKFCALIEGCRNTSIQASGVSSCLRTLRDSAFSSSNTSPAFELFHGSDHICSSLSHISIEFPDPIFYTEHNLLPYCMGDSF